VDDISQIPLAGLSFLLLLVPHSLFKEKERNKEEESRKSVGESPGNWIEDDRRLSPSFHQAYSLFLLFIFFGKEKEREWPGW
jgi:hypothetical protein